MSGILDPKERVIDAVITQEGKRQISTGGLDFVFATVSDRHSYYEKDIVSGSTDATRRIYFEPAIENINDSIIMESDDSGFLLGYPLGPETDIGTDGSVSARSYSESTGRGKFTPVETSKFASTAESIVKSSIDRFTNLQSIGTRDPDEAMDLRMEIQPKSHTFVINNKFPFVAGPTSAITNVDFVEPLFFDEMLSKSINFQYLPPLKSESENSNGQADNFFGNYTKFHRPVPMDLESIMEHLNIFPENRLNTPISDPDASFDISDRISRGNFIFSSGGASGGPPSARADDRIFTVRGGGSGTGNAVIRGSGGSSTSINLSTEELPRERVSIFFDKTSSTNNIMMQMFESNSFSSRLKKLDVIHYSEFNSPEDANHPVKNVFFAGKIFVNSIGLPVFINLFTIIID